MRVDEWGKKLGIEVKRWGIIVEVVGKVRVWGRGWGRKKGNRVGERRDCELFI